MAYFQTLFPSNTRISKVRPVHKYLSLYSWYCWNSKPLKKPKWLFYPVNPYERIHLKEILNFYHNFSAHKTLSYINKWILENAMASSTILHQRLWDELFHASVLKNFIQSYHWKAVSTIVYYNLNGLFKYIHQLEMWK